MKNKTTAQYLLDLIFEGHEIRYVENENKTPLFIAKDVCSAIEGKRHRDLLKGLERHQRGAVIVATLGGPQEMTYVTQSGLLHLCFKSRKPAARRFQVWMVDEVIPQLIRYGSYIPGATVEDRLKSLYHRWKKERVEQLDQSQKEVAEAGLETISSFCKLVKVETRDILKFSGAVRKVAKVQGYTAERYFLNGRMTPAWPPQVLEQALVNFQPSLNLNSEKGGSN